MIALLLMACAGSSSSPDGPPGPDTDTDTDGEDTGSVATAPLAISVEIDPDKPTVVHVEVSAGPGATSVVHFGVDGATDRATPAQAGDDVHHHVLLGGVAGRTLTLRAEATDAAGTHTSETVDVPLAPPPDTLPELTQVVADPASQALDGWIALAGVDTNLLDDPDSARFYVAIVDGAGDYVWWHFLPEGRGTTTAMPSTDGRSLLWPEVDNAREDLTGHIVRMALDGEVLSTTVAPTLHHALAELPGGRFAYLGRGFEPAASPEGQWWMTDHIYTIDEGDDGTGAQLLFDYLDGWWLGDLTNYWLPPCDQVFPTLYGYPDVCELTHSNSLTYEPTEDALYAYARVLDTTLRVDASTGVLDWQLGGATSDFTFPDGSPVYEGPQASHLWSHGHFSHVWPGGMVLFDNGWWSQPQVSALAEYSWDEGSGTVREVWRYTDPQGGYTASLGDVRRLSGGTYLASWMSLGRVNEIAPGGAVLWQLDTERDIPVRRVFLLEDLYDLTALGIGP